MAFNEKAKLTALAIVHIFETSEPLGDYSAVAVLKDGAGVSYGKSQFTHKSGSLAAVLKRFQKICKECGTQPLLEGYEKLLADRSARSIDNLSHDQRFKNGLKAAGRRPEMQQAQREIAFEKYLKPAIDACEGSDFVFPLSLAVVYDSINHGSFAKIRDRVVINKPGNGSMKPEEFERAWITLYVQKRDYWLEHHANDLVQTTDYRTDFFLAQIARGNWNLDLPLNVHGHRLTEADISVGESESQPIEPVVKDAEVERTAFGEATDGEAAPGIVDRAAGTFGPAAETFDKVNDLISGVAARTDSAKSLWTTVTGTAFQVFWAVFGFLIGLPKEVWIGVAIVAAAFGLYYLHRQIALGKIREMNQ